MGGEGTDRRGLTSQRRKTIKGQEGKRRTGYAHALRRVPKIVGRLQCHFVPGIAAPWPPVFDPLLTRVHIYSSSYPCILASVLSSDKKKKLATFDTSKIFGYDTGS